MIARDAASRRILYFLAFGRGAGMAGATVAFVFFSLYLRLRLGLPASSVGLLVGLLSAGAVCGTFAGGWLADKIGRRPALLLTMAVETAFLWLLALAHGVLEAAAVGFVLGIADGALWPTFGAAVADLLPPSERRLGFSLLNSAVNAGAAIGPAAGGLLLAFGFPRLFVIAGLAVAVSAGMLALGFPETRAMPSQTISARGPGGYGQVFRDGPVLGLVLTQLPVLTVLGLVIAFLPLAAASTPDVGVRLYGFLIAGWGAVVALLQLPVTRLLEPVRPVHALAAGAAITGIAFVPIALFPGPVGFALTILGVALGEVVTGPSMSSLIANMAPVETRARYQSLLGLNWSVGGILGPAAGGLIYAGLPLSSFWLIAGLAALVPAPLFPLVAGRTARVRRAEDALRKETEAAPGSA